MWLHLPQLGLQLYTKSLLTVDTERSKKLAKGRDKSESKQKLYAIGVSVCYQFVGWKYWAACKR